MTCVSASARVPSGLVCDLKRQAAELRRTGREAARGFIRKNRRGFSTRNFPARLCGFVAFIFQLLQFSAAVKSQFPPKKLQAGSANVD